MSNDFGTIKAVFPSAVQTAPAAPLGRAAEAARTNAAPAKAAEQAEPKQQEKAPLEAVVSKLNDLVHELHRELQFSVDDKSGETVIKVIDSETDEVVRQIPSEEVVRLRERLREAAGVIFQDLA
jgi:flagellar protein FlaG